MENKIETKKAVKKEKKLLAEEFVFPEGVTCALEGLKIKITGPKGELVREFHDPRLVVSLEGNKIKLTTTKSTKREKKLIKTSLAHIKNLSNGVVNAYIYKMKVCASHFPMNVSVKGDSLEVKNFIGEKVPRVLKFKPGVNVKVNGDEIIIEATNKELAGQTAGDIEQLTRRAAFDRRIFQDGIYITEKDGKAL